MDYSTKTPGQLADVILERAAEYEDLADELGVILEHKDLNWSMLRDTVSSDKQADRLWHGTRQGAREQQINNRMRTIQRSISNIKMYLKVKENEAHNLY